MEPSNSNRNSTTGTTREKVDSQNHNASDNQKKESNGSSNQGATTTTSSTPSAPSFVNPYLGHRALTPVEQELLGEYARLAATIKRITSLSRPLSSSTTHSSLLNQLRILERKMGLVLTLFKASVWAIVVQQQDEAEEARLAQEAMEYGQLQQGDYTVDENYGNYGGGGDGTYGEGGGYGGNGGYERDDTIRGNGNGNSRYSNTAYR